MNFIIYLENGKFILLKNVKENNGFYKYFKNGEVLKTIQVFTGFILNMTKAVAVYEIEDEEADRIQHNPMNLVIHIKKDQYGDQLERPQ